MPIIEIPVTHTAGLHARPASLFVRAASAYPCTVLVSNITTSSPPVNAKSILKVLTLGVNQGCMVRIETEGEKADEALENLRQLIMSNFGETE